MVKASDKIFPIKTELGLELNGVRVDFDELLLKFKMQPLSQQPLLKAIGAVKDSPRILDVTAGLCKDAFLMAMRGHSVVALERSKDVADLVLDGFERAKNANKIDFLNRLDFRCVDAFVELQKIHEHFDVLYLDPMYPQRETSALPKKEMQVLRHFLGTNDKSLFEIDQETTQLLQLALQKTKRKVVLKRPLWAEPLMRPRHTIEGKLSRFDIYIIRD